MVWMLVLLLLMHLLVVDYIIVILFCIMFQKVKTDRLQKLQNQCARILTKPPHREHIIPVLKKIH